MAETGIKWYYITPDDIEVLLNDNEHVYYIEDEGCGIEDLGVLSHRVAFEHGEVLTGLHLSPRSILLRLGILEEDDISWRNTDDALCRNLSPFLDEQQAGVLRRVRSDGETRDISALLVGYSKATSEREGPCYGERALKFWCPDPFFYDPDEVVHNYSLSCGGGMTFPYSYPRLFTESNINSHESIYNEGDTKSWPIIRIEGPLSNPQIENETTGEYISLTIDLVTSDFIQIDMEHAYVYKYTYSEDKLTEVSNTMAMDSVFWALRRGENLIHTSAQSAVSGGITFTYHVRYQCA